MWTLPQKYVMNNTNKYLTRVNGLLVKAGFVFFKLRPQPTAIK